ncbi:MAG: IPT/TIG domain-containing protein [Polyangiaceae bacterium]
MTVGSPDTTITILGSNFVPTSVVTSGGVNANATFVSASVMTFVLPAAKLATPASYSTTVTTPSPGGGTVFGATVDVRCDDSGVTTQINAVANPVTVNLATRYGGSAEQMISAQTGSGFCPTTIQSTTGRVAAIVVQNGTAATRQLSAWNVCSFSNESAVLAFYNRATVPVFAADRAQCTFRVGLGFANSTISPERGASSQCPGLSAGNALTMPMCGRAVVFVQSPTGSAAPASLKVQLD